MANILDTWYEDTATDWHILMAEGEADHDPDCPICHPEDVDWDEFNPFIQPPTPCQFCGAPGEVYNAYGVFVATCEPCRI